jgi:hypothetical protein
VSLFVLPRLWPDPKTWELTARFLEGSRFGIDAVHWDSGKHQEEDDGFTLDIRKRHENPNRRARLVSKISFRVGLHGRAFPQTFALTLVCRNGFVPGFQGKEMSGDDVYEINLPHPAMIEFIIVDVLKPRSSLNLVMNTIVIHERRLFCDVPVTPYDI